MDQSILAANICELLLLTKNDDYLEDMVKLLLQWLTKDRVVLLLTFDTRNLFSILVKYKDQASREQWKRLIIMQFNSVWDMSKKINQMHVWRYLPSLIWLDLYTLEAKDYIFMHHLAFTLANFRSYVQTVVRRKKKNTQSGITSPTSQSSLSLCSNEMEKTICLLTLNRTNAVVRKKLFIVKNLGFYKPGQVQYKFESLREHLSSQHLC